MLAASWHDPKEWQWFALRTAPGRELAAERLLREEGLETFLPIKHHQREKRLFARARLAGYLFVGANGGNIPWPNVLRLSPIIGVVAFNGSPIPFPARAMYSLALQHENLIRYRTRSMARRQRDRLSSPLQIRSGPYAGLSVCTMSTAQGLVLCRFLAT